MIAFHYFRLGIDDFKNSLSGIHTFRPPLKHMRKEIHRSLEHAKIADKGNQLAIGKLIGPIKNQQSSDTPNNNSRDLSLIHI